MAGHTRDPEQAAVEAEQIAGIRRTRVPGAVSPSLWPMVLHVLLGDSAAGEVTRETC